MDIRAFYYLPNLLAAVLTAMTACYLWPRRSTRGAKSLFYFLIGSAIWAFCEALLYIDNSIEAKIRITQLQYVSICTIPANFFIFIWRYVGWDSWLNRQAVNILYFACAIMLGLAWTNGWHGWVWAEMVRDDSGPFTMLALTHGPAFWLWVIYSYLCIAVIFTVIFRAYLRSASLIRRQYRLLFVALLVPCIANLFYIYKLLPVANMDPTPISFCVTALLMGYSFVRHRMYDVMPVARDEVFFSLSDGIMVFDNQDRVAFINPAAEKILGRSNDDVVGKRITRFVDNDLLPEQTEKGASSEMTFPVMGEECTFDLRVNRLAGAQGEPLGWLLVWRDITERKRLEDNLRYLAATDPLTGVYNRRHFMKIGTDEVARCRRYQKPMSLLMLDIDHFKMINDKYGHDVGDLVLQAVTSACRQTLRDIDTFGRIGGEEFAVIMPETDIQQAVTGAQRLRKAVMELKVQCFETRVNVTVSIGAACLTEQDQAIELILKKADQALYQAKNSGRNRVCLAADFNLEKTTAESIQGRSNR